MFNIKALFNGTYQVLISIISLFIIIKLTIFLNFFPIINDLYLFEVN
jgi:hypothetical protein